MIDKLIGSFVRGPTVSSSSRPRDLDWRDPFLKEQARKLQTHSVNRPMNQRVSAHYVRRGRNLAFGFSSFPIPKDRDNNMVIWRVESKTSAASSEQEGYELFFYAKVKYDSHKFCLVLGIFHGLYYSTVITLILQRVGIWTSRYLNPSNSPKCLSVTICSLIHRSSLKTALWRPCVSFKCFSPRVRRIN